MKSFSELFRKYRLRSEFETIASFSDALAEKGYFYEESIFYHWQKGTRFPHDRKLILTIIKIFVEKEAMQTTQDVNEFLETLGQGYLTEKEKALVPLKKTKAIPFQVPSEINDFVGRESVIHTIKDKIKKQKIIHIYGAPGIGKTALAIRLGHLLKNNYTDGVLWYKVDSTNISDILLSIAQTFGENISLIRDIEIRASTVRALLTNKKVLLIFDNTGNNEQLYLLLPNSPSCTVLFTSRERKLSIHSKYEAIELNGFTQNEVYYLFNNLFGKPYIAKYKKEIITIAKTFGFLPIAIHIVARYIKLHKIKPKDYLIELQANAFQLENFTYENNNLAKAIELSYSKLDKKTKDAFISLGIFDGKDFSVDAVAYINKFTVNKTQTILQTLTEVSLIEKSQPSRYRIHPVMKNFARNYLANNTYLRGGQYYEQLLNKIENKNSLREYSQEVDNLIYIFKKCYEYGFWDLIITLWNPLEKLLADTNEIKKLRQLTKTIDTAPSINFLQKTLTITAIILIFLWIYLAFHIHSENILGATYSFLYSIIPFVGGLVGILRARIWGLFKSNIGKAIFFISAGLFSWGVGNIIWAFYNFFQNNDIPYPSLADIGFFSAYLLWITGVFYLSRATGAKFYIFQIKAKLPYLILPFSILVLSYYILFFVVERAFDIESPLVTFFDIYYPTMDIIILTLAIIIFGLSVNFFRGKYRLSLFSILSGFVGLYIADFMFSYTTSAGVFYTGGTTDLFFMLGFYFITMGTLNFYLTPQVS